jgi:hypothetical protein
MAMLLSRASPDAMSVHLLVASEVRLGVFCMNKPGVGSTKVEKKELTLIYM